MLFGYINRLFFGDFMLVQKKKWAFMKTFDLYLYIYIVFLSIQFLSICICIWIYTERYEIFAGKYYLGAHSWFLWSQQVHIDTNFVPGIKMLNLIKKMFN